MELTLSSIITLVATTGIFTALLNQFLSGLREWWTSSQKRRAHAGYHALRLAVVLEAYAYECSDFIDKNDNAQTLPDQEYPEWDVTLPGLPAYPDDAEGWQAIDLRLAARALNLRNRITGSQDIIASTIEFSEDDLGDTLDEHASERGLEAWEIAVALRRKHGLDPVELIWDFVDSMQRTLQKARDAKAERRERNARAWEAMKKDAD